MSEVSVGVIGCGKIAKRHLGAYNKIDGVEVTVTDIDQDKVSVAEEFGVGWCDDPGELVADEGVDAVDVCTPITTHTDLIVDALDNDKHVFCEKPLARTTDEAMRIQEKAENSDRIVMIGYLYRFHPAFQFVKEVIEEGVIGDPYFASFRVGGRGSHKPWKHRRETGGGAGNEMLVHMLDLALWYFGEHTEVNNLYKDVVLEQREIDGQVVEADAEDFVLLRMEMEDDVNVLCQSDLITPSYMNYLEVHGTNGSVLSSILDYFPTLVYCKEPRGIYDRGNNFRDFPKVDLFEKELTHFLECVRNGCQPKWNSVEDSVNLTRVVESSVRGD